MELKGHSYVFLVQLQAIYAHFKKEQVSFFNLFATNRKHKITIAFYLNFLISNLFEPINNVFFKWMDFYNATLLLFWGYTVLFLPRYGNISSEIRCYLLRDTLLFLPRYAPISFEVRCYFFRDTVTFSKHLIL